MRRSWLVADSSLGTSGSASRADFGEVTHVIRPMDLVGDRVSAALLVDTKLIEIV